MKTLALVASLPLCLPFTKASAAVDVNWNSTGALSPGESSINTTGALVYAYNLGNFLNYTINEVKFDGTASGGVGDLNGEGNVIFDPVDNGQNVNGFSNLGGDFGALMNSAQWGSSGTPNTITLGNLTAGQEYLVQVFSSDNRTGRDNSLSLDNGTANEFNSVSTGEANSGAFVTGTFTADASGEAQFTFAQTTSGLPVLIGNANLNAIQVRKAPRTFVHPGIGLSLADLNQVKANLNVEPWKTGYDDLAARPEASLNYTMKGPHLTVGHTAEENRNDWRSDMIAVHHLARMWFFTDNAAYAQKAHDILLSWANTHTTFLDGETYLDMGYHAHSVFEGAEILRGTWPGWTQNDTDILKVYFQDVWWDSGQLSVPNPMRSANQGMAQFAASLGVAIFNDDDAKFEQCLESFRTDAPAALLSSLPNGQIGDTGRDSHDQGQLGIMAWAAECFWTQGVDVFSEYDNRLLAAAEYISRINLQLDPPFIQAGTVYDVYPDYHSLGQTFENWDLDSRMVSILHSAFVVRAGLRSPYLEQLVTYHSLDESSFCYVNEVDTSTAASPDPLPARPTASSVTSLSSTNMGDATGGGTDYNNGTWTLNGRGSRMWHSSVPDYHFAYLEVSGDATIIAKLNSLTGGSSNDARAGLVFTENLTDSADMQAIIITHPDGVSPHKPRRSPDAPYMHSFRRGDVAHAHQGNDGSRTYSTMANPKYPYWLKIERIGDRVNCFSSPDGISWSCGESAEYNVGSTAYFGLAVSSDQFSSTATATFSNVQITGGDGNEASQAPPAPFAIYASPGGDVVPLRWLESFEAESYNIWRSTQSGGPYTLLTQETGTSFLDTSVNFGTQYYYTVSAVNAIGESPRAPEAELAIPKTDYYEAEDFDAQNGVGTESTRDFFGGRNLSNLNDGDWTRYDDIPLTAGAIFQARVASFRDEIGNIEVRLDSPTGTLIGTLNGIDTGGAQAWGTIETSLTNPVGVFDLYLVFTSVNPGDSAGLNLNWFDIIDPNITDYDLGSDTPLTFDPNSHALHNCSTITNWDASSTYLQLLDGSDLSTIDFAGLGITSWTTTDFGDPNLVTNWDRASLNGITLNSDGNFGAGDSFTGTDFSNLVWGTAISTADPARFFSGGSGSSSAATALDAINFSGADLSLISGQARTTMINNLGGFDGETPVGAQFDPVFITNSGWDPAELVAAGWQYDIIDAFSIIQAEDYDEQLGVDTQATSDTGGGLNVQAIDAGDYTVYRNVDFGSGANQFQARVATRTAGGNIEIRLGSPTGTLVGTCLVTNTGNFQRWVTRTADVSGASGIHDVYLTFTGGSGTLFNLNWFTFTPAPTFTLTYTAGANGSISGTSPQTIAEGSDGSAVTAVPDADYSFVNWSDNSTANPRTDLAVTSPLTVTANFESIYSDHEHWRFLHFGTYANTGNAADDFDADFDGIPNLLEYATGLDPNDGTVFGVIEIKDSPTNIGKLELTFNRIDDTSLQYTLQSSDTLGANDWTTIFAIPGGNDEVVTVPESQWPANQDRHFFRLGISN